MNAEMTSIIKESKATAAGFRTDDPGEPIPADDSRPPHGKALLFAEREPIEFDCLAERLSDERIRLRIDAAVPEDVVREGDTVTVRLDDQGLNSFSRAEVIRVEYEPDSLLLEIILNRHALFLPENHTLNFAEVRVDPACAMKFSPQLALSRKVLPFAKAEGVIHVACPNEGRSTGLHTVERLLKDSVQFWPVDTDVLNAKLRDVFGDGKTTAAAASETANLGDEILYAAFLRRASDIHIDPGASHLRVRFRVDGALEVYSELPMRTQAELINRFKVLSSMDIAEKRAPQDGRFTHQFPGSNHQVDIRVASLPTKYGERLTLRLLALQTASLTLNRLGLDPVHTQMIENFLRRSQGMMILTGPTGSGKTTTLYAAIRMLLNERHLNVMTIEDPIEYTIDGVAQCEVDSADKVSFGKALRSILRHDPDVVMIGEIRDEETAGIAIKAALTGHLVLGTLHTNSAAATITRLLDMNMDRYLVAATLRLSVAQRLCRKLCRYCRVPRPLTRHEAVYIRQPELAGHTIYEPSGCIYCSGGGFNGRIGLYEMLELDTDLAREVVDGAGENRIVESMREAGIRTLLGDALEKLLSGTIHVGDVMQIAASW